MIRLGRLSGANRCNRGAHRALELGLTDFAAARELEMRNLMITAAAASAVLLANTPALAKGHILGGAAGAAVAGKHHRVAGAVVGGAVGHHMAKTHDKKQAAAPK